MLGAGETSDVGEEEEGQGESGEHEAAKGSRRGMPLQEWLVRPPPHHPRPSCRWRKWAQ